MGQQLSAKAILCRMLRRARFCAYCLVSGSTTTEEIALRMGIQEQVVKNYLFRIYDTLGVSNRVECALYIVRYPGMEDALKDEFEVR
jgi:DNA-binding NarL/FixJ family response regulator